MNMLEIRIAYEKVRKGDGPVRAHNGKTYQENLMDFIDAGLIDQEEAQLAIINGTKRRAAIVLRNIQEGHKDIDPGTGKTYGEELRELVNRGYMDQEDAHLALYKRRIR